MLLENKINISSPSPGHRNKEAARLAILKSVADRQASGSCQEASWNENIGLRPNQIADRFMGRIWNPYRCEFTRPVQFGQVDCNPSVGFDPIAGLARDQRRCDHDAFVSGCSQLTLNAIIAWVHCALALPQPSFMKSGCSLPRSAGGPHHAYPFPQAQARSCLCAHPG